MTKTNFTKIDKLKEEKNVIRDKVGELKKMAGKI